MHATPASLHCVHIAHAIVHTMPCRATPCRFVDVDIDVAMERVLARQVAIGLAPEVSRSRIAGNDRPNAELIARTQPRARVLVPSTIPFKAAAKS